MYSAVAPNFCAGCGTSLRDTAQATHRPVKEAEAHETAEEIPHITQLAYEIEVDATSKKITLGDIMKDGVRTYGEAGPPAEGPPIPGRQGNPVSKALSKEDVLKEGLSSCRSARGQLSQEIEE